MMVKSRSLSSQHLVSMRKKDIKIKGNRNKVIKNGQTITNTNQKRSM